MIATWRRVRPFVSKGRRIGPALLAIESALSGLLEAALLVLLVNGALAIAEGNESIDLDLPLLSSQLNRTDALIIAAGAGVAATLLHVHTAWLTASISTDVLRNTRERAIRAFTSATWQRQSSEREGSLQETVSTLAIQTSALVVFLANGTAASLNLTALFIVALVVEPVVTAAVLAFGALLFALMRPLGKLTRRRATAAVRANSDFTEQVGTWSSLAMELRIFGVEGSRQGHLLERSDATAAAYARTRFVSRSGSLLYRDVAILFTVIALAVVSRSADLDLAAVGAVVLLIVRSLSYAQQAQTSQQQLNEQLPNMDALLGRVEILEREEEVRGNRRTPSISPIEIIDVCYRYGGDVTGVEQVNLRIDQGEALGVIGPSGSGKSTLAQVVLRLRTPTSGRVLAGGVEYTDIEDSQWTSAVALVPQEPRLFEGTIAENIAFFRRIDDATVRQSAAAAHVLDEIERMSSGFETVLGPRGTGLSGGQKQRIAIARALAGGPELLVLDEPTSALDVRSEQLLQETIEQLKGSISLMLIAHRLSTLSVCDRVVGMVDGRVIVEGTLDEALAKVSFERVDGK